VHFALFGSHHPLQVSNAACRLMYLLQVFLTGDPLNTCAGLNTCVCMLRTGDPYISFVNCHKGFLADEGTLDLALYAPVRTTLGHPRL